MAKLKRHKDTDENRKRPYQIKIRVNAEEAKVLEEKIADTDMSMREFIIKAIYNAPIVDKKTKADLDEAIRILRDIQKQAKGMGVNTNQMAKVANTTGQLPRKAELDELTQFNLTTGKEVQKVCQLLNPLIHPVTPKAD